MDLEDWDIISYLEEKGVDYRTSGKNIAKGSVGVLCPRCSDRSYHLNISIEKKIFHCWRCGYSGNAIDLIVMVEGGTKQEAYALLGDIIDGLKSYEEEFGIQDIVGGIFDPDAANSSEAELVTEVLIPGKLELLQDNSQKSYWQYLVKNRKFLPEVFLTWDCYYCTDGDYKGTLIFPIVIDKQMVTFTSRTIYKNRSLRYKTLAKEKSIIPIKDVLYLWDEYEEGDTIILVEGIFDALRLRSFGYKSVGVFNMQLTSNQLLLISDKMPKKVIIMLDRGQYIMAQKMAIELNGIGCRTSIVNIVEYKDPAECVSSRYMEGLLRGEV